MHREVRWKIAPAPAPRLPVRVLLLQVPREDRMSPPPQEEPMIRAGQFGKGRIILQVITSQELSINRTIIITAIPVRVPLLLKGIMTEELLRVEVVEHQAIALQGVHPT